MSDAHFKALWRVICRASAKTSPCGLSCKLKFLNNASIRYSFCNLLKMFSPRLASFAVALTVFGLANGLVIRQDAPEGKPISVGVSSSY
ncbi:hypothetical protein BDV93DRAFT_525920, partial [Ceratobasidium sp. AG-I]